MSSVVNILINNNGVLTNKDDVINYIDNLDLGLNSEEYLLNLVHYLMHKPDIKNRHDVLVASNNKLKEIREKELIEQKSEEEFLSSSIVRARY